MNEIVRCGDLYWTKAGKPKFTGAWTTHGGSRLCTLPCDDTPTLADVLAGFARIKESQRAVLFQGHKQGVAAAGHVLDPQIAHCLRTPVTGRSYASLFRCQKFG